MTRAPDFALPRRLGALALLALLLSIQPGGGGAIAQVSTAGASTSTTWSGGYAISEHHLPDSNSQPWSITVDQKGMVWFVEQGTNQLGEYEPTTGAILQYPIPTPRSTPDSVAADHGGNIWFSELTSNTLGELPAGASSVVEFPIPGRTVDLAGTSQTLGCGPGALLSDSSGNVWVACLFSNQIDEFHPGTESFDRFELPVFQSGPAGLVFDGHGNLWFTASDAQMLGKVVLNQVNNNTSDGITEFAPINETYLFRFTNPTSFLGSTTTVTSSLPTPSGIAISPSGRLWVTEHVDNSFDSYDPSTQSLVKYWTSQTSGAYGFTSSFPNGIAVDGNGTVWIGEHYGNKIAEFTPAFGRLTEYPAPCCASTIAGVYSVALGPGGTLWFVEINGNAIGELAPAPGRFQLTLSLPHQDVEIGSQGSLSIPLRFNLGQGGKNTTTLSLAASGITGTGALQNSSATFSRSVITLTPGGGDSSNLTLSTQGLKPGIYYITLSATASPGGVVYSSILKVAVTSGSSYPLALFLPVVAVAAALLGAIGWTLARRSRSGRRRFFSDLFSLQSASRTSTTPAPTAA